MVIDNKEFTNFSERVENYSSKNKIPLLDSILHYCEKLNIDPLDVNHMINNHLKEKLELEVVKERMIKSDVPNEICF